MPSRSKRSRKYHEDFSCSSRKNGEYGTKVLSKLLKNIKSMTVEEYNRLYDEAKKELDEIEERRKAE